MKKVKIKTVFVVLVACIALNTLAQEKKQVGIDFIPSFMGIPSFGDQMSGLNVSFVGASGSGVEIGRIQFSGEGVSGDIVSACYVSKECYFFSKMNRLGIFFDTKFGVAFSKTEIDVLGEVLKTSDTFWDFGLDLGMSFKCSDVFFVDLALSDESVFLFKDLFDDGGTSSFMGIKIGASYKF